MKVEYFISENFDKLKHEFQEIDKCSKEKFKKLFNFQNETEINE